MKFDEFKVGQILVRGPYPITREEILTFARAWDPQWFHTDPARAERGPWKGLIASGWQTCGIAMRLAVTGILDDSETFGSPGLEYLKWLAPVRPGDSLTLHAEVLDVRCSEKKPTLGILRWRWRVENQEGIAVLELVATSLFDLDPGANG
ncbi:MAG TPA: MaoC family dehydratase [Casimicrobiaceae bacterium]